MDAPHQCENSVDDWRDNRDITKLDETIGINFCNDTQLTLNDFNQVTTAYGYWKAGCHNKRAGFDVHFQCCPFGGEFCVLAGIEEVVRFLNTAKFSDKQMAYFRAQIPHADEKFMEWLSAVDTSEVTVHAICEGTFVFPRVPIVRIEGPLAVCQLLVTPLTNLLNFPSLVATNAARFRLAAGWDKKMVEFGVRRAQGPDGAISASRYSYVGTFDGTSHVRAARLFDIPVTGTHAHSFVGSFSGVHDLNSKALNSGDTNCPDFVDQVMAARQKVIALWGSRVRDTMNDGELAAFIAYAQSFPKKYSCLVDTYDTCLSGVPNFLAVAYVLDSLGLSPHGVRLDSGDLSYLSRECRRMFSEFAKAVGAPKLETIPIVASNDINETVLHALKEQKHCIDVFGIGTNLVTCQAQPSLGLVCNMTELEGKPCMKATQEMEKATLPFCKSTYRLHVSSGPVCDLIQAADVPPPKALERIECRHMLDDKKRCYIVPSKVEPLLNKIWDNGKFVGDRTQLGIAAARERCKEQMTSFRRDHLRYVNPTPYKVSGSAEFYLKFRTLWNDSVPMTTIE